MEIRENEGMSAVHLGIPGSQNWLQKFSNSAAKWFKAKIIGIKSVMGGLKDLVANAGKKIKGIFNFLKGWAKDDPIGFAAGAGAVLITGAVIIGGGAVIGAVGGATLAFIGKVAALGGAAIGALKAAGGAAISFMAKNKLLTFLGSVAFGPTLFRTAGWVTKSLMKLWTFNWNISEEAIAKKQDAAITRIAGQLGETSGMLLGGIVCGNLPGVAQIQIDTESAAQYWLLSSESAREEVIDSFTDLAMVLRQAAQERAFLETYKNARNWARENLRTGISSVDASIQTWGKNPEPWILAEKFEEAVESIPNEKIREFTENFFEGFGEICLNELAIRGL